jgi:hypothetical protein
VSQVKTQREIEDDAAADYERTYQESQDRMRVSTSQRFLNGDAPGFEDQKAMDRGQKAGDESTI